MSNISECLTRVQNTQVLLSGSTNTINTLISRVKSTSVQNVFSIDNDDFSIGNDVFSIGKSFSRITKIDDIYLGYIQFRTLYRHFCMNNILFTIGIKGTPLCNFCLEQDDSNEHMYLEYPISFELWNCMEG